jgi:hypothetical protein
MAAEVLLMRGMSTEAGLPIRRNWLKQYGEMRGVHGLAGYGDPDVPYPHDFAIDVLQTVCRVQITQRFTGYPLTDDTLVEIGHAATRYMERWTLIGRWKVTAHQYAVNVPDRVTLHFERKDG